MKTTVVEGVLTSYELVLAILFRWRARSCVRDIVRLWRSHVSGHGPDHHTLATWYCANTHVLTFELQSIYLSSSSSFSSSLSIPSLFRALFSPLEMRSALVYYARIVVSIGNEGHKSSSALAVTLITLEVAEWYVWYFWVADGQMMFGSLVDQRIAHPWSSYGLKMFR